MAGHSKFKNIMHRKGAQDKKRAKLFAKLAKEITVAAKMGAPDPAMNPRLRLAIANAKGNSMPKDNIERAINKGAGGGDDTNFEECRYEGYGPGGIAFIVEALTDNRNRTASEVRTIFAKGGGNLGETGSVTFMFDRVGEIVYPAENLEQEKVFEAAIEAGADDIVSEDEKHMVYTQPDDFNTVREGLEGTLGEAENAELIWKPKDPVDVSDKEAAEKVMRLMDTLDDCDDVQSVSANFDVPEEVMQALQEG